MSNTWEVMLGYCMTKDERYGPPARLKSEEELKAFLFENVQKHYELRVVDLMDLITFQVVDQELVFPPTARNRWDQEAKLFILLETDS